MILRPLVGAHLVAYERRKPWDENFRRWIAQARLQGGDPNDFGDQEWADDPLHSALAKHYLPNLKEDSVLLELGPGSGRLTRHLVSRCREMILIDYSELACEWLRSYLAGRGRFVVHHIVEPAFPMVPAGSVDNFVANGVFEHVDVDDMAWFLEEIGRVLRPGGRAVFNFDNAMSPEGIAWFRRFRNRPGDRNPFRFYHPGMVRHLAEQSGLRCLSLDTDNSRFAYIVLEKPLRDSG